MAWQVAAAGFRGLRRFWRLVRRFGAVTDPVRKTMPYRFNRVVSRDGEPPPSRWLRKSVGAYRETPDALTLATGALL